MRWSRRAVTATALAALAGGGLLVGATGTPSPRDWPVDDLPSGLDRSLAWHDGVAGIEWAELRLRGEGEGWRTRVIVARVAPRRVALSLDPAFARDRGWRVGEAGPGAALAVNAGQFRAELPWGWVVSEGQELLGPQYAPLAGAVVVERSGAVRIVSPDRVAEERKRGDAREAFQSYPMLLEDGEPPPALVRPGLGVKVSHRDARLALGTLPDGRVVVALTRFDALGPALGGIPFGLTSAEMAGVMRALGAEQAILLDGGISGQLMVRDAAGAAHTWAGVRSVPLGLVARTR